MVVCLRVYQVQVPHLLYKKHRIVVTPRLIVIQFTNTITSLTTSGNVLVTGNVTASKFYGDGLGLTSLNASNINSGTLSNTYGGTGVTSSTGSGSVVLNTNPTFSGTVQGGTFSGSGSGLTSLNATNISTGTLPVARGGTGCNNTQ